MAPKWRSFKDADYFPNSLSTLYPITLKLIRELPTALRTLPAPSPPKWTHKHAFNLQWKAPLPVWTPPACGVPKNIFNTRFSTTGMSSSALQIAQTIYLIWATQTAYPHLPRICISHLSPTFFLQFAIVADPQINEFIYGNYHLSIINTVGLRVRMYLSTFLTSGYCKELIWACSSMVRSLTSEDLVMSSIPSSGFVFLLLM